MFAIAGRGTLDFTDPPLRGHSIEFRINAEDPGRGFLPTPGTITAWRPPAGPGVPAGRRLHRGMTVPQAFDFPDRQADRDRGDPHRGPRTLPRALAEFEIEGMPTVLPFHRAVVRDPAFAGSSLEVHTRWIETEFAGDIPPYAGQAGATADGDDGDESGARERITVEVGGKRLEVTIPASLHQARGGGAEAGLRQPDGPGGRAARRRGAPAAAHPAGTPWSARCRARSSSSSPPRVARVSG